jgi:hypothetical protein
MCWWKEGEQRGSGGWRRDPKVLQLTLIMEQTRAEVLSYYVQRADIPSKRVVYTLKYSQNTTYAINNKMCLIQKVKYIYPLPGKNKPHDRETECAFILAQWTVHTHTSF